jgi:S-DNA-T family DNA segregation ATPase FtsK/SpoIIIE
MFDEAVKLVQDLGKASSSLMQRRLKLGYARAARVLDQLEQAGIVGPSKGAKPRDILIPHNSSDDNSAE